MSATRKASDARIYQLKVTLRDTKPPIWRRIQVPGDISLSKLHQVLQVTMGWTSSHLYQFVVGGAFGRVCYGDPHPDFGPEMRDARKVRLSRVAPGEKAKLVYEYDFGDSWEHQILVEKVLVAEGGIGHPRCLAGRRACPPEDCGGVWGYAELLETIRDPDNPEHDSMLEWLGGEFDPEEFDLDAINQELALTEA